MVQCAVKGWAGRGVSKVSENDRCVAFESARAGPSNRRTLEMPLQGVIVGGKYPFEVHPCATGPWCEINVRREWGLRVVRAYLLTVIATEKPSPCSFHQ